ncbi:hypothetical protein EJB05_46289, partial [Eragrostis curvula]
MYIDAAALGQEQPCSLSHLVVAPLSPTLRVGVDNGMASFPLVGQPTGRLRSDLLSSSHLHGFGCEFTCIRYTDSILRKAETLHRRYDRESKPPSLSATSSSRTVELGYHI